MCWRAYSVCFFFYKIRLNAGSRVFSGRRYCESVYKTRERIHRDILIHDY